MSRRHSRRTGAVTLEAAFVYPVLFLFLFGLIVGGLGVMHYQQVACQARETSRFAAVHGSDWAKATAQTSPTAAQIASFVVVPLAAGMDTSQLTVQVQWINGATGTAVDWAKSSQAPPTNASGQ